MNTQLWNDDLMVLQKRIEETHPYPYGRISREEFQRLADSLRENISNLTESQIIIKLMQLVSSLQDGHTTLRPIDPNGFNFWYPVRYYWFIDGIFITATGVSLKALNGAQVLEIGQMPAEQAAILASSLRGADNWFGQRERIHYLANATALFALGISSSPTTLSIKVKQKDGLISTITLEAVETQFQDDRWMFWGEMYGPPGIEFVSAFQDLASSEFRKNHAFLPLHVRNRIPFFSHYLVEENSIYMQFNFVQNWEDEKFSDFHRNLFTWIDNHSVDRFILDLRYNSGGNGGLLLPFVHQFIKRDTINRPGHLYILVGRKTFSAGVNLIGHLTAHTHAFFVGEPAGASLNHFGDAVTYLLPNSGLELQVSRLYHQMSTSDDKRRVISVQYPAIFDSSQYFSGQDPALDAILGSWPRSIPDILWEDGEEPAMKVYQEQARRFSTSEWWQPYTENQMNDTGYRLLETSRVDDAAVAFQLNVTRFPESWNAWDSLAEIHQKMNHAEKAKEYYKHSLTLNPGNSNAREILKKIDPSFSM